MTDRTLYNQQIAEEAADWAVALESGALSPEKNRALADWLLASPRHVEELLINASLYNALGQVDPEKSRMIDGALTALPPEVVSIMRDRREAPGGFEVAEAQTSNEPAPAAPAFVLGARPWPWIGAGAAAALALMVAVVALAPYVDGDEARHEIAGGASGGFATALGEQRKVTLEDGSIVHVNTQSEIAIRYTDDKRIVQLLRGEALFDVAHNPSRPFRVMAGDTIAEAVGTTFNVYRTQAGASVAVIDGKVAVTAPGARLEAEQEAGDPAAAVARTDDGRLLLEAGQKAEVANASNTVRVAAANIKAVSSWSVGQLIFESERLSAIAEQFNRYNRIRIIIDDKKLGMTELSGVFDADDPESLISTLEVMGGVLVDRSDPNIIRMRSS